MGAQCRRIHLHASLTLVAADDVETADALDGLDARLYDLDGEIRDLADGALPRLQRDGHDRRVVGIEVLDDRLLDVLWQRTSNASDLRLHVLLGDADLHAEIEHQPNDRDALERRRSDLLDALNGVERLLDRLRDVAHHHFGRRARIRDLNDDDRIRDVRIFVDRQTLVAHDAEYHERHHHHGGEHGSFDGDVRKEHGLPSVQCAGRSSRRQCLRLPALRSSPAMMTCIPRPSVPTLPTMTRSPACSPSVTCATPCRSSTAPSCTGATLTDLPSMR